MTPELRTRLLLMTLCAFSIPAHGQTRQFTATVEPQAGENFAASCSFELSLPNPEKPIKAVWLTYDRGYDISRYYSDGELVAFAAKHGLALILAHQCPAKEPPTGEVGEMEMDPSRGIARSIFTALDRFAQQSNHPELSSSKLIVLGFSGTGALFAHFVSYASDRVLAAILANSGQTDPFGMDRANLSPKAINVPQLIIVGGADEVGGTQRNYDYFARYRERGAPWVFLVQNGIPHCCVIDAKAFVLDWLDEMIELRTTASSEALRNINASKGWVGFVRRCDTGKRDHWGDALWNVCSAIVLAEDSAAPPQVLPSGWFPTRKLADRWLAYAQQKTHPADSFPFPPKR
jgi:dienelactone hydrolase